MADNVGITPGTGATAAADDIGGVLYQRVKVTTGADGVADGDVSSTNPMPIAAYGELIEAIEAMRMAVHSLTRSIGFAQPNPSGQPIFEARQPTAANFLATVSQGTAANLQASVNINANQTLTNITQLGGYSAAHQIPATMAIACEQLRRNITVTRMTTTNGNRPILDLKRFEFCSVPPAASAAGSFIASSRHYRQYQLFVTSNTTAYLYLPSEDGWLTLASPALAGTFGVGASGVAGTWSTGSTIAAASLTATGGTTSTIITNQTLARDLRGYSVHILSGPNAGVTLEIRRNTVGANATITVDAQASAFTASTVYRLITPRWYVLGAGTLASGSFKVYDFATNTWTTLSQTGLPGTIGTAGKLVNTPSWINTGYNQFATGTASAATATTLSDSTKSWTASQWVNFQVRIVGGTGAGQIRTITASTGTQLTVATWTVTPDATSTYSIEGNDDFLYYMGNNAVTLYRYSISGNSWSTLAPGVARAAAPGTGMSGHWIYGVTDSAWTSESAVINGRRIYSFRGGNGALLDYYDIPSNAWTNGVSYAPAVDTYTAGTKFAYNSDYLYILQGTNGRWFRYSYANSELSPWSFMAYAQGSAIEGDTAFDVEYKDGATVIPFIYVVPNTLAVLLRQMVF